SRSRRFCSRWQLYVSGKLGWRVLSSNNWPSNSRTILCSRTNSPFWPEALGARLVSRRKTETCFKGFCPRRSSLEHRLHDASVGSQRCAIHDASLRAGHEGYDGGHFLRLLEAFQQRGWPHLLEESPLYLSRSHALLLGNVLYEGPHTFGRSGPHQD